DRDRPPDAEPACRGRPPLRRPPTGCGRFPFRVVLAVEQRGPGLGRWPLGPLRWLLAWPGLSWMPDVDARLNGTEGLCLRSRCRNQSTVPPLRGEESVRRGSLPPFPRIVPPVISKTLRCRIKGVWDLGLRSD